MTEVTQGLFASVIKGRYSSLKDTLSEDDISQIWNSIANYVEKQMMNQKGVQIPGLGVFSLSQKKLEIGNNKFILTQRPVFNISEKFAQTHGLQFQKYYVPGSIPALPLNLASISFESPFDRDTVERCVKEIIGSISSALAAKRNIELCFSGIGRLTIREGRVKMKFYKEFVNEMDSTRKFSHLMMNRAGTVDSVMSNQVSMRPHSSNTLILPNRDGIKIAADIGNLTSVAEEDPTLQQESNLDARHIVHFHSDVNTTITNEEGVKENQANLVPEGPITSQEDVNDPDKDFKTQHVVEIMSVGDTEYYDFLQSPDLNIKPEEETKAVGSFVGSRVSLPMAKAIGISLSDELNVVPTPSRKTGSVAGSLVDELNVLPTKPACRPDTPAGTARTSHHNGENIGGLKLPKPPRLDPIHWSSRLNNLQNYAATGVKIPLGSACSHPSAGQELCYLCHQRARMNVPVSFAEDKRRREKEEDRLLHQCQVFHDAEETLKDLECHYARQLDLQKIAAFNLGVAEALHSKKKAKDLEPQQAYIFSRRPLTPSRVLQQETYLRGLNKQVDFKLKAKQKKKTDEEFLERLEQVQLAEDLAAQREQYLRDKAEATENYKKSLDVQLRFQPLLMPEKEPDNEVFGKNDMNNEKMAERRHRAYNLFQEQQGMAEQQKRDAILLRLTEQQQEEGMLTRAQEDLKDERTFKHMVRFESHRRLENDWQKMVEMKRARELEDRLRSLSPGILLHEQCDHYNRCRQCKRHLNNCGETNIWSESRYIPGSRIMV